MTDATTTAREDSGLAPSPDAAANSVDIIPVHADSGRVRYRADAQRFPVGTVLAACVATHFVAASFIYRDLARDLYALFDATPRLLVLEQGLTRLTAATVFLPPLVPSVLLAFVALWLGRARRAPDVARWLAVAAIPLALDTVMRAIGVVIAPAPSNLGELLDLPVRFSPGPRMLLDLLDVRPGPSTSYWVVVCTAAALLSAWCVRNALLAADAAERDASVRRRRRGGDAINRLQLSIAVAVTWIALAFVGQLVLPFATQLFLRLFG
ncbi:MAG: hypothetical protein ACJ79K_17715 [Gemmatimonadaceae bacterium]